MITPTPGLGSGFGGGPVRYAEDAARSVTGLEISKGCRHTPAGSPAQACVERQVRHRGREKLLFPASTFDLVTMFDVMEHVVSPQQVLGEGWRVLRPNGLLATVFPPYYHLRGGSHLEGYATTVREMNLLFSTRALKRAAVAFLEGTEDRLLPLRPRGSDRQAVEHERADPPPLQAPGRTIAVHA